MDARDYWDFFMETGAPELYLMYAKAARLEAGNVSENESTGHSCYRVLQ